MPICRSSWVLVLALWSASPQQEVWAGGSGAIQPPAPEQVAGRSFAPQASNGEVGSKSNWRATFSSNTVLGLALTGSGVFFIEKGFDFRREADVLYDRYLDALDPTEISLLYQRTNKRDLKSRLSWALGAVLAASGIRILFGRQLAALHLELAPSFSGNHPHGAQVTLSRDF